jgi:hypothetical protein
MGQTRFYTYNQPRPIIVMGVRPIVHLRAIYFTVSALSRIK